MQQTQKEAQQQLQPQNLYLSPNQKAFKRLKRNKPAVVGFVILCFAVFIAVFAYFLAPDPTTNANDQVPQMPTQPVGFKAKLLKLTKDRTIASTNFFTRLLWGIDSPYELVPLTGWHFEGDSLLIDKFTTAATKDTTKSAYHIADVVYALATNPDITKQNDALSFTLLSGERITKTIGELQKNIETKHIISKTYLLGTDKAGRDNLSRLILGVRVSLSVGIMSVLISLIIGVVLGAVAGYFRGKTDDAIMWFINVFWSVPLLLMVFPLVMVMGRHFWQIYLAVGLTMWVEVARLVRGQFLSLREKEYVEAAKSLGFSHGRIIFKHILPNAIGPIVVVTAANFPSAIIIEAGLSFLGIGVELPTPSWGSMLNEYYGYVGTSKAFLALIPGTAICVLVLAFYLIGNGLSDALNVKVKTE